MPLAASTALLASVYASWHSLHKLGGANGSTITTRATRRSDVSASMKEDRVAHLERAWCGLRSGTLAAASAGLSS